LALSINRRRLLLAAPALALPLPAHANPHLDSSIGRIKWMPNVGTAPMSLGDLLGKPVVLTMSYTACRRTCSTTMLVLREIQAILDRSGRESNFAIVSYDPERDSPAGWTEYRKSRGLDRETWHFLTGTPQDTRRLARFLDVDFWRYGQHILHDFRIVLFDAKGRWHKDIVWDRPRDLAAFLAGV
jgi:cytochrome oxidase Cu insertion factor (SCO1/SenC/PrrC family)